MTVKPPSIKLAGNDKLAVNKGLSEDEIKVINNLKHLPVSEIILKIWGLKRSKNPKYKLRKEQVETILH